MQQPDRGLLSSALAEGCPSGGRWTRRVRRGRGSASVGRCLDWFRLILLNPSCGGHRADLGEKREPREMACIHCQSETSVMKELDTAPPR